MKKTLKYYQEFNLSPCAYFNKIFSDCEYKNKENSFTIIGIKTGKCKIRLDNHEVLFNTREFIIIFPNVEYTLSFKQKCEVICLSLNYDNKENNNSIKLGNIIYRVRGLQILSNIIGNFHKFVDTQYLIKTLEFIITELENNNYDDNSNEIIKNYLNNLFIYLGRSINTNEEVNSTIYIKKATDYLNNNFTSTIHIRDIADYIGINENYLQRLFKTHTNKTIIDYLNMLRINRSKILLKETNLPLIEIGIDVGFNNRQHFTNIFKKFENLTPAEYRKTNIKS